MSNAKQTTESFSEKQLQAILNNTVDGIIVINNRGIIMSFNPACEELFGYTAAEAMNQNVKMLMPESYATHHDKYISNYTQTREPKVIGIGREVLGQRKDKSTFPMWLSIGEVIEDGSHFFVGIVRDLSEQRDLEIHRQLYMEALEISNRELDDFVYLISHDLKEPVRGIYSYAQFMAEDYNEMLDEDGKERLGSLMKMSRRMSELIDKLLEFSRINRSEPHTEEIDLDEVLSGVLEMMDSSIKEHQATITYKKKLPKIAFDPSRCGEIFYNLILNGLKYNTSSPKEIEIGMLDSPNDSGQKIFYVKDNGIGIPEKHHDSVFKMFKRLHGRDAFGGGTGAGLTIIKRIINKHGGNIWIKSPSEGGTIFYFTLEEPIKTE
ncbi:MAG TPA: PAS domain S-box protein [Alphaproteobacteria bacterium]|nr:PAS domain S-box protein [Alphaproteobacteria bacterium]HOO50872.1 PAS domain S-box protein [Alphaproteobacteria bacterium]